MKKVLSVIIIAILAMLFFSGISNAAGTKTVTQGSTVSVTISLGKSVTSAGFDSVSWSSDKLQYVSNSLGKSLSNGGRLGFFGDTERSSITLTFKAIASGTATVKVNISEIGADTVSRTDTTTITITAPSTSTSTKPTTKPSTKPSASPSPSPDVKKEEAPNEIISINNEDAKKLLDKTTNIIIKSLATALEDNTQVKIQKLEQGNEKYSKIEDILKEIEGKKIYYDIKLIKDNIAVQPNGYVTVFIPIPEGFNRENLELYYIDIENGKYELIQGKVQENYYTFTTNHFSVYALVDRDKMQNVETELQKPVEETTEKDDNVTKIKLLYVIVAIQSVIIFILLINQIRLDKRTTSYRSRRFK